MRPPFFLREVLGVFVATLLLVGAPALLMFEELRDPSCPEQVEASGSPFRVLAVDDHRIVRCLGDFLPEAAETRVALAESGSGSDGRALPDPTW